MVWEGDGTRSSTTIIDGSTSYTLTGLEEDSSYTITVTATNAAGSAPSYRVTIVTEEVGKLCTTVHIRNSYIMGPSFVADLLHRKSARAIARGLLRAINRLQNEGM